MDICAVPVVVQYPCVAAFLFCGVLPYIENYTCALDKAGGDAESSVLRF
jgi:hypothetical protein